MKNLLLRITTPEKPLIISGRAGRMFLLAYFIWWYRIMGLIRDLFLDLMTNFFCEFSAKFLQIGFLTLKSLPRNLSKGLILIGDRDRIRTCDRLLRRQMLYPAELRDQNNLASNKKVGVAGFEPATSASQTRRDNRATLHPEFKIEFIV